MELKKQQVLGLLNDYKDSVINAIDLLNEEYELDPLFHLVNRSGHFTKNKRVEYSFHGIGCLVKFKNGDTVDFDFLHEYGVALDPYFINWFLEDQKDSFPLILDKQDIIKSMEHLVQEKVLVKVDFFDREIYFFKYDYDHPSPLVFGNPNFYDEMSDDEIIDLINSRINPDST